MKDSLGKITFISLIVAILGVVVPIGWDYYSSQKGISLTLMSQSQIISANTNVDGLEISYKGTRLSSLTRLTFLIENTGNKPILESDVVSPIRITISDSINILDTIVDSKIPSNLDFLVTKDNQDAIMKFSLLNPGDQIFISLLVDSSVVDFSATARIAGVRGINVNQDPPKTLSIWAIVWIPVGLLSFMLLIASIGGFIQYPQEFKVKSRLKNGQLSVPDFRSYEEAHEWVSKTTSFITESNREPIFNVLKKLEENKLDFDKELILVAVKAAVNKSLNNLFMASIVSIVGLIGIYYSIKSIGYF
ncbi:hypothetical protein ACRN91_09080 [Shewanella baltica]|uniref:hypothetical protein n=1 Tax=Shewanella baltica TaxID=62322 RepID=UPI003D7BD517